MKTLLQLFSIVFVIASFSTNVEGGVISAELLENQYTKNSIQKVEEFARLQKAKKVALPDEDVFDGFKGFGSMENAVNLYALPNSNLLYVGVYQKTGSGYTDVHRPATENINFTVKAEFDAYVQERVEFVAQGCLTNNNVNKDQPFGIFVWTTKVNDKLGTVVYFYLVKEFFLTKSDTVTYNLPDFSWVSPDIAGSMVFEVSGLEWGRFEVTGTHGEPVLLIDPFVDASSGPPDEVSIEDGYFQVSTRYATSGLTGPTRIRSTMVTSPYHKFQVFGEEGTKVPEKPIILSPPVAKGGKMSFNITGGERGRVLLLQSGPTICGPWTDVEKKLIDLIGQNNWQHEMLTEGDLGFSRVIAVDEIPYRVPGE